MVLRTKNYSLNLRSPWSNLRSNGLAFMREPSIEIKNQNFLEFDLKYWKKFILTLMLDQNSTFTNLLLYCILISSKSSHSYRCCYLLLQYTYVKHQWHGKCYSSLDASQIFTILQVLCWLCCFKFSTPLIETFYDYQSNFSIL